MHTYRKTTRRTWRLGALGMTVAASLATTACQSGDGKAGDDASPSKPTASATRTGGSGNTGGETGGTSGGDGGGTEEGTCTGTNTHVTLEFALPAHKDDAKLLLTVTNTSDKPCNLYGYPAVRFGQAQSVPPPYEDSKPQAVVVLDPGKEGYAGVLANQGKEDATTEKTLTVAFQGKNIGSDTGEATSVKLPTTEGIVVDDTIHVTYWQDMSENAVSPLFHP